MASKMTLKIIAGLITTLHKPYVYCPYLGLLSHIKSANTYRGAYCDPGDLPGTGRKSKMQSSEALSNVSRAPENCMGLVKICGTVTLRKICRPNRGSSQVCTSFLAKNMLLKSSVVIKFL